MLFFNFPLTFFRVVFFLTRSQSRADRLKYTLVFKVVLGAEWGILVTKLKCSDFRS